MRLLLVAVVVLCAAPQARAQMPEVDSLPRLLNAAEVGDTIDAHYPERLRMYGVGVVARLETRVTTGGTVDSTRFVARTGLAALDRAAMAAAATARFRPAMRAGQAVPMRIVLPVAFGAGDAGPARALTVRNREQIAHTAHAMRPRSLAEMRAGAEISLAVIVGADGEVDDAVSMQPSCFQDANLAARRVAQTLVFEPLDGPDAPSATYVTVIYSQDAVIIQTTGDQPPPREKDDDDEARERDEVRDSKMPSLRNRRHTSRLLERNYPPELRSAGIGGDVLLWQRIDEEGNILWQQIRRSSGHCELDLAALAVGAEMDYEPAILNGRPVAVWVQMPVAFRAR